MNSKSFDIYGMSCSACSQRIENALKKTDGVKNVSVNLLTNSMSITYDDSLDEQKIIKIVTTLGYGASVKGQGKREKQNPTIILLLRLIVSLVFLIPLLYVSMGHVMWGWPVINGLLNPYAVAWYEFAFSLIIIIINNKFFVSGTKAFFKRSPNMDTLVSMGSGISFIYSLVLVIVAYATGDESQLVHNLYFESAAMILVLITLGKMLESISKGKTTSAIKSLMSLAPKTATIICDGEEKIIPVDDVKVGDIFVVRPGSIFPVDGVVIDGVSAVDESSLTGESIPVDKTIGSKVSSGTVNINGYLKCEATAVLENSTLTQIIKLVENTNATKAPISKVADKVSGIFVPTVISIAIITFIVWIAVTKDISASLSHAICVLVISCPCALGLATPVAIMVGSGYGARRGVLFKSATAIESAGKTDIIVFDKTGTLTTGKPTVTDVYTVNFDDKIMLSYVASVESRSEHPLSRAISEYAISQNVELLEVEDFVAFLGHGVQGRVNNHLIIAGNMTLLSSLNIPCDFDESDIASTGKTPIFVAIDNVFSGIIAIRDEIKPEASEVVKKIKKLNINVVMLTGDNEVTANAIAKELDILHVVANVLPSDKDSVISTLQNYGKVTMVGDGINDAPALTRADTGIAIAGTDIAKESADIVLMRESLNSVYDAIAISKKSLRTIRENLFGAFIYNIICIPIAAGIMANENINLTPMISAIAMSLSSVTVVTNALLLRFNLVVKKHKLKKLPDTIYESKKGDIMKKTISIEGMMCNHCTAFVKKTLEGLDGVESADVSLENKNAIVTLSKDIPDSTFVNALQDVGYTVVGINN